MNVSYNFDIFDDSKHPTFRQKAGLEPMHYNRTKATKTPETDTISNENRSVTPVNTHDSSDEEWSFFDFLDIINPLQHIPIVNSIYREMTGDEIKAPARILGGTLFGGFGGAATSIVNAIIEDSSGKDIGEHMIAMTFGEDETSTQTNQETADEKTIVLAQTHNKIPTPTQTSQQPVEVKNDPTIEIFARQFIDHEGNIIQSSALKEKEQSPNTNPKYQPATSNLETSNNVMLNNYQMPHLMIEALDKYQQMQTISQSKDITHGSLF